jgi:MATE family multidrug resistance protein
VGFSAGKVSWTSRTLQDREYNILLGRQHLGAFFNIVAYYLLALPLGLTLAFKFDQGLQGLWIGQVIALFIVGLSEYGMVWLGTNWEKEITRAAKRVALEHQRSGNK